MVLNAPSAPVVPVTLPTVPPTTFSSSRTPGCCETVSSVRSERLATTRRAEATPGWAVDGKAGSTSISTDGRQNCSANRSRAAT